MQIVVNIEKKHLIFFSIFLIMIFGLFYVMAATAVPNPGHSVQSLGTNGNDWVLDMDPKLINFKSSSSPVLKIENLNTQGTSLLLNGDLNLSTYGAGTKSRIIFSQIPNYVDNTRPQYALCVQHTDSSDPNIAILGLCN